MEVLLHMFERETNYMATVWVALDQFKSFNLKAYCINIQCSFFANIYMNVMTCSIKSWTCHFISNLTVTHFAWLMSTNLLYMFERTLNMSLVFNFILMFFFRNRYVEHDAS